MKKTNYVLLLILVFEIAILSILYKVEISLSLVLTLFILIILMIIGFIKKKEKLDFLLLICLLVTISFMPFLLKINIFCFVNDQYIQYDYISEEWSRMLTNFIKNGSYPFYSFNTFLGNDFISSKSYYITGDILYPIVMLFKNVNEGHLFETEIIVALSSYFTYLYFIEFGIKNKKIIIASSILYAFSGISSFYSGQYFWHRFIMVLPYLLYSIEKYRKNNSITRFIIAVSLCFLMNYYYMFPTSIFLIFYFIFTYYYHLEEINLLTILKKSLKLILAYVIGFLLSGIIMIPTIMSIVGNERVGTGVSKDLLFNFKVYLGYLYNLIIAPLSVGTKLHNNFIPSEDYHLWGYTIYTSSIIAPITFSYLFVNKNDDKDIIIRNFIIITTLLLLFPITNSIIHGFSGASMRITFLASFVYLIGFAIFFDKEEIQVRRFIQGFITFVVLFVVLTSISIIFGLMKIELNNTQLINAIICMALLVVIIYLLKEGKTKIVLLVCCVETIFMYNLFLHIANLEYRFYEDNIDRELIKYINDKEEDKFYRISIDTNNIAPYTNNLNQNQSLHYGYKSVDSYDTTYESSLDEFIKMSGINGHIMNISNPEVKKMLGVRYYYVLNELELPKEYDFTYITNNNNFKVYKMNDYKPIGFTYSLFTNDKDNIVDNNLWNSKLYIGEDLLEETKDIKDGKNYYFELSEYYDDNNLKGHITTNEKRILFFSIPYNEGWRIKDNGVAINKHKVQGGFLGVVLEPGQHYIELNFTPPGFKTGCITTFVGFIGIVVIFILEKKKSLL